MDSFILILIIGGALATAAALGFGLYHLLSGRDASGLKQNRLMWWRVALQGATVLLVLILALIMAGRD